jgi:lipoate-protein ligase A
MWSIVTPYRDVPPLEAIHAAMLDPLAEALSATGRNVAREGTSDLVIRAAGRAKKISGNALRVRRQSVLYHGTLLDAFPLELVGQLLRHPPREPEYRRQRSHSEFLTNLLLGREQIDKAVRTAFAAWGNKTTWPHQQVRQLVESRYEQTSWTERL